MPLPPTTDVLIVGGGPVGLLTGVGLTQQDVDCLVIEKRERDAQASFGRATTLYPRSLELLEQLDLTSAVLQEGFVARASTNYKDGVRANERGWNGMFNHCKASFHDYALNIRQRYSEDVFRSRYESYGKAVWFGWKLLRYEVDQTSGDDYNITAVLGHEGQGESRVRCKYLLGADGGASSVRQLSNISLDVDPTTYEWIRIDGKINTDMPDADIGFASIETPHHGNILWVKLDHDAHRIGYALTPSILAKYPNGITQAEAVQEAVEGMKPFQFHIERLDWWTHYKIRQSVAKTLQKDDFVLLGGDAAHTHSSGFAQGMNTGVHDATNLVWKLAGTIKGWYKPEVLSTYASERRAAAQKLIQIDREAAATISGDIPARYEGLGASADEVLMKVWTDNIAFNLGLGVSYGPSIINHPPTKTTLQCGVRSPDALIRAPGPNVPIRLHDVLFRNGPRGCWSVVVYAGNPNQTRTIFPTLRQKLSKLEARHRGLLQLVTLLARTAGSGWMATGGPPLGKFYFDSNGMAHSEFGVDEASGALVVIRPDGILGFATGLDNPQGVDDFFGQFIN